MSGTTTQFLYDNGSVDEEMQGTTVTADYGASAEKLSGTVSWMLQDGQGSTRQLLNSSQTVVASYISDAFGNSVGGSGSSTNPFIWNGGSGYYSDAESGLQKVGARYYDPAVGRWISQDTEIVAGSQADSQAVNRYAYCGGNPVAAADPSGHFPTWGWILVAVVVCVVVVGLGVVVLGWAAVATAAAADAAASAAAAAASASAAEEAAAASQVSSEIADQAAADAAESEAGANRAADSINMGNEPPPDGGYPGITSEPGGSPGDGERPPGSGITL
ncbi:MAG TPA: RHS repeat-associated core domain-containing protein [Armatimonadota bacterium]|nr:RHS repeat-associated core domain-containing protein [Armatimonadota bacterium]